MEDVSQDNAQTDTENERGATRIPNPQGARPKRSSEKKLKKELNKAKEAAAKKDEEMEALRRMIEDRNISVQDLTNRLEESDEARKAREEELATLNTPQERVWRQNVLDNAIQVLQKERHFPRENTEGEWKHPGHSKRKQGLWEGHPNYTSLNLEWSHRGGWFKIPRIKDNKHGPNYVSFWIVRIEPYIDEEGIERRAFCYGDSSSSLYIWYSVDEQLANSLWEIPQESFFENALEWRRDRLASTNSTASRGAPSRGRAYSRGRGGARGRGGGRGYQQSYYRENEPYYQDRDYGAPERHSSGVGRSSGSARDRDRVREISPRVGQRDREEGRAYYRDRDEGIQEDYRDEPRPGPSRYEERAPYQRNYREYYDQEDQEDYYQEERPSREGGRGNRGAERARTFGYRGRET